MKKMKWIGLMLLMAAFVTSPMLSDENHGDHEGHGDMEMSQKDMDKHHDKMAKKMGLSKDQKAKMKALHQKSKEDHKSLHEQMKQAKKEMGDAMKDPQTSDSTLREKHKKLKELGSKKGDLRFEKTLAMRKILTPEQLEKMASMKGDRKGGKMGCKLHGPDCKKKCSHKDGHGSESEKGKKCSHKDGHGSESEKE